jgi:small subunit ribosomal protein S7
LFKTALDNVKPIIQVKSRRVGGQPSGPTEVALSAALLSNEMAGDIAQARTEKSMPEKLALNCLMRLTIGKRRVKKEKHS